jgi:hypothetical protein
MADISAITGIPQSILSPQPRNEDISVAQIMSWAARRRTTRIEDAAYSLLGLFGVNMPMIYGEGEHAFIRLQEEILKVSDDRSIFSWTGAGDERGPLAASPAEFYKCGYIGRCTTNPSTEYAMTNKGLRITLPIAPHPKAKGGNLFIAFLTLGRGENRDPIGIYLREIQNGQFVRARCEHRRDHVDGLATIKPTELYITRPRLGIWTFCSRYDSRRNALGPLFRVRNWTRFLPR